MTQAKIKTTPVAKDGFHLGWKVYIEGEKFPKKPQDFYGVIAEETAVKRAWNDYNTIALTKKGLTNIGLDDSGEEL